MRVKRGKEAAGVVLGRSGNDLLSRVLRHSTIGAEAFNGRVRDGIGFFSPRSNHRTGEGQRQRQGRQGATLKVSGSKVCLTQPHSPRASCEARTGAADHSADSQAGGGPRRRLRPMLPISNGQGS